MSLYGPYETENPEDYRARIHSRIMREIWRRYPTLAERMDPEYRDCPARLRPEAEDYYDRRSGK